LFTEFGELRKRIAALEQTKTNVTS
jgi:hypothetical protein